MIRIAPFCAALAAVVVLVPSAAPSRNTGPPGGVTAGAEEQARPPTAPNGVLVALDRTRGGPAAAVLRRNGAVLVSRALGIWRLQGTVAARLLPALRRSGRIRAVEPDQRAMRAGHLSAGDPLVPTQAWMRAVGADRAEPPGPGRRVTVIDSGLDLRHPEFSARANTVVLNEQFLTDSSRDAESHGTAVASVVGAPANGIGIVGVYPQAVVQAWDGDRGGLGGVIEGIEAAVRRGPSVINLSLGFRVPSRLLAEAVNLAVRRGSVVVAAAGNDRARGSPAEFPAALPHVVTVAATDAGDAVASFSTASASMDLAAPGVDVPIAVPTFVRRSGFAVADGTSFSAPIVSGAAAWIWTARPTLDATQVVALLRSAARDIGAPGFDSDSGAGILNIPAALVARAPSRDPYEPNDDVSLVKPNGVFGSGTPVLPRRARARETLSGRLAGEDDPRDVYRVRVPARGRVALRLTATADLDLELWRTGAPSVLARGAARRRHLIARSARRGSGLEAVSVRGGTARARVVYAGVRPGEGVGAAAYKLVIRTTAR